MQVSATILDFIFPKKCVGCSNIGDYFCLDCLKTITQTDLVCPSCERPSLSGTTHPICRRRYGLDGLWSLGIYQDPLRRSIQKLKYRFVKGIAQELVNIMINYWAIRQPFILEEIEKDGGDNWVIVPVPLHWQRQNWRGFNQSALLAAIFAQKLGLKYEEALIRTKNTIPQMKLLSKDRKQNIKGAFSAVRNPKLAGKKIILFDDVWTTGSTLKECGYILKRNGAIKVWAVTIAR